MATIRKLRSGKWNLQIRSEGRLLAPSTHRLRKEAEAWAREKEQLLLKQPPLVLDADHAYCHGMLERKPSQILAFNRIDRICKHPPMQTTMDKINLSHVSAYKQARFGEVSPTTCRDELMMIRRVFHWYIRE